MARARGLWPLRQCRACGEVSGPKYDERDWMDWEVEHYHAEHPERLAALLDDQERYVRGLAEFSISGKPSESLMAACAARRERFFPAPVRPEDVEPDPYLA